MSEKEKVNNNASEEKVVTKYDLKMQKRKEEKAKEEKEKRITSGITIVVLLALVCFVLSFPIRTYLVQNGTYVTVGGEDLTKVAFDYSYNVVVNNYVASYSSYLSYFGLDPSKDLSTQTYSGEMSWKDYFEEMTIESIKRNKSLKADAAKAGFTYDTTEDYNRFVENQKAAATAAGVSLKAYVADNYGEYATLDRIKPSVEEALFVAAYYDKITKDRLPAEAEVQAVYDENPADYDSVDYYIHQIDAEIPEEATDEQIENAMKAAKADADKALAEVKTEDNLLTDMNKSGVNSILAAWLFDDSRKSGDKEVLEDAANHRYYCVQLDKRYLNQNPTADIRVLVADSQDQAKEIFDAWKNAGANEEAFIKLCDGDYYENAVADGGLIEGMARTEDLYEDLLNWIFDKDRKQGDCDVVNIAGVADFVVYYVGENKPEWYGTISGNLQSTAVNEYVSALTDTCTVSDPKGRLKYIKIRAAQEAAAQESAEVEIKTAE